MRLRLEAARSGLERSRVVDAETGEELEDVVEIGFSDSIKGGPRLTVTVSLAEPYVTSRGIDPEAVRRAMR